MICGTNVLPGDVAMVVAPFCAPGRGAIVEVLRPAERAERIRGILYMQPPGEFGWVVEGWVQNDIGLTLGPTLIVNDRALRKMVWSEREDEMLVIAGRPPLLPPPRMPK